MKHTLPILLLLVVFACSCKPSAPGKSSFVPLQNGFGVVVQEMGIDSGPGAELYYKGTNERPVLVWPCIGTAGYPILYTNDIALMLATKPDREGRMGGVALIAVQAEGPAMDISDDILKNITKQAKVDFQDALRTCRPAGLTQIESNTIQVIFGGDSRQVNGIKKLKEQITWENVFSIIEDVKKTGRTNKVTNTDVLYLQKDHRQ